MGRTSLTFALVFLSILTGCGNIEPEAPVDEAGEPIPVPAPMEEWLRVVEVTPQEEISLRPVIEVRFNAYLDPATFTSFGAVQLNSGGLARGGRTEYFMTRKSLVFRPNADLEPELRYALRLPAGPNLRSVTASPLHPFTMLPELLTDGTLEAADPIARPVVAWPEVEEIFETHCNECHGDNGWQLPALTRDNLVRTRSTQVEAFLVEPYHPARSYLMHKILPDYPIRRFTVQPPPWSAQDPLTKEQIERIEHWIANGAPGN